jgi:hypothetical protein
MTHEEEVLENIKLMLLCNNESLAIRILEQYSFDKIEEFKTKK